MPLITAVFWESTGLRACTCFSFKKAANDLIFSVKSFLVLRKSDCWTTTETGMTASCLIMHKDSFSLKFTTPVCPFRISLLRSLDSTNTIDKILLTLSSLWCL